MSYGFKFFNNNNETVIDDTGTKPWYFGEAPVQFFFDITNVYTDLNKVDGDGNPFTTFPAGDAPGVTKWNVYTVTFAVPIAYDCFVAFSLPNTTRPVYYAFQKNYALVGDSSVRILIFVPNTIVAAISDIPKAYIFVANPVPTANLSTGFGLHVFNASQQCTYDSNKRHFQPTELPLIYINDPTNYVYSEPGVIPLSVNETITFPASAAVILPYVEVVNVVVTGEFGSYNVNSVHYQTIYRREGIGLITGVPRVYTKDSSTTYTQSGFFNQGAIGLQSGIILDAAPLDQGYTAPEFPASYSLSITRTNMIEGYDPKAYDDLYGKYVFKKRISSWLSPQKQVESDCSHLYITRMYSFCISLFDNYLNTLPEIYRTVNEFGVDTEHAHFGNTDKNLTVEFENLYCEGVLAGNGQTEKY
jgi:hypothetical protein